MSLYIQWSNKTSPVLLCFVIVLISKSSDCLAISKSVMSPSLCNRKLISECIFIPQARRWADSTNVLVVVCPSGMKPINHWQYLMNSEAFTGEMGRKTNAKGHYIERAALSSSWGGNEVKLTCIITKAVRETLQSANIGNMTFWLFSFIFTNLFIYNRQSIKLIKC